MSINFEWVDVLCEGSEESAVLWVCPVDPLEELLLEIDPDGEGVECEAGVYVSDEDEVEVVGLFWGLGEVGTELFIEGGGESDTSFVVQSSCKSACEHWSYFLFVWEVHI